LHPVTSAEPATAMDDEARKFRRESIVVSIG